MKRLSCALLLPGARAALHSSPSTTLSNGLKIPLLGFGTASLDNDYEAMGLALDAGYTLVDTASVQHPAYHNPAGDGNAVDLGRLLHERGLRESIVVLTKNDIWAHGFESTLADVNRSLSALQTTYIDAFLIHSPNCVSGRCEGTWRDTYRAMEKLYDEGVLKSIGVSNFNVPLMRELLHFARVKPHIVQNKHDPLGPDWDVVALCKQEGIFFQSFSTLGRQYIAQELKQNPDFPSPVLTSEVVQNIARQRGKSPAQIVLRWAVQDGLGVIPKSTRAQRIKSNSEIFDFELTQEEMSSITALQGQDPRKPGQPRPPNEVKLGFKNTGREAVDVFWRDAERGNLQRVFVLQPEEEHGLNSFLGHEFVVQQGGRTLSTHVVRRAEEFVEIGRSEL